MFCKNCGTKLNDDDMFCSGCGEKVNKTQPIAQENEVEKNQSAPNNNIYSNASNIQSGPYITMPNTPEYNNVPPKNKGHKSLALKIIIPILAFGIIAFCILNAAAFNNYIKSHFSSPKEYFKYVATKESKKYGKYLMSSYDSYKKALENSVNSTCKASAKIELSDEMTSTITAMAGSYLGFNDLSSFKSIGADLDYTPSSNAIKISTKIKANDKQITSGSAIIANDGYYIELPELNKNALYISADEYYTNSTDDILSAIAIMQDNVKRLPDKAIINKLFSKYSKILIDNTDAVTKSSDQISVEDISQNATLLTVSYSEAELFNIMKAMANEAINDKDIESLVSLFSSYGYSYEDFIYNMRYIADMEPSYSLSSGNDSLVTLKLWVNKSGDIIGIQIDSSDNNYSAYIKTATKGTRLGVEIVCYEGSYSIFSMSGTGKLSGTNISGSYDVYLSNENIMHAEIKSFDVLAALNGSMKYSMDISLPILDNYMYSESYDPMSRGIAALANNCKIGIEVNAKNTSVKASFKIKRVDTPIISLDLKTSFEKSEKITKPTDAVTADKWIYTLEPNNIIEKLRGILPDSLLDSLKAGTLAEDIYGLF